jgi:hypothetical protein
MTTNTLNIPTSTNLQNNHNIESNDISINNMFGNPNKPESSMNTNNMNIDEEELTPFSHLKLGSYTTLPNSGFVDEEEMITTPIGLPPRQLILPPAPDKSIQNNAPISIPLPGKVPESNNSNPQVSRPPIELISDNINQLGGLSDDMDLYRYIQYLDSL